MSVSVETNNCLSLQKERRAETPRWHRLRCVQMILMILLIDLMAGTSSLLHERVTTARGAEQRRDTWARAAVSRTHDEMLRRLPLTCAARLTRHQACRITRAAAAAEDGEQDGNSTHVEINSFKCTLIIIEGLVKVRRERERAQHLISSVTGVPAAGAGRRQPPSRLASSGKGFLILHSLEGCAEDRAALALAWFTGTSFKIP